VDGLFTHWNICNHIGQRGVTVIGRLAQHSSTHPPDALQTCSSSIRGVFSLDNQPCHKVHYFPLEAVLAPHLQGSKRKKMKRYAREIYPSFADSWEILAAMILKNLVSLDIVTNSLLFLLNVPTELSNIIVTGVIMDPNNEYNRQISNELG
ncbi:hypothetical protein ACJX0J_033020, partial [Zea mays]